MKSVMAAPSYLSLFHLDCLVLQWKSLVCLQKCHQDKFLCIHCAWGNMWHWLWSWCAWEKWWQKAETYHCCSRAQYKSKGIRPRRIPAQLPCLATETTMVLMRMMTDGFDGDGLILSFMLQCNSSRCWQLPGIWDNPDEVAKQVIARLFSFFVSGNSFVLSSGLWPDEAAPDRPGWGQHWPPLGVTGSLVRSQGAVASNGGALHLVSRPQETGKQNLLLHAVLPNPQPSPMA